MIKLNVIEDFLKIKAHLDLPDELELHLKFIAATGTGRYRSHKDYRKRIFPSVTIGLRDGYDRKTLVHECLHATGLKHDFEIGYTWDDPKFDPKYRDTYSHKIMDEIFGV